MRERIVVPLDGSEVGESALPYVEDILTKLLPEVEREVITLQVLTPVSATKIVSGREIPDAPASQEEKEQREKEALDYLNRAGRFLESKGIKVTARVAVGDAVEQIIHVAEEVDADLIALSTHGRSGLSRWAFGSVTERVLRSGGRTPIVVIKAQAPG